MHIQFNWTRKILVLAAACLLALSLAGAQTLNDEGKRKLKTRSGVTYPELARRMNISGKVRIELVIEDNLAAQTLLASQYDAESEALLAAHKQLEIANNRYRDGLITYLEVATAESTALNIEFSATQLRGQQLVAAVTLVKALGGGWQETGQQ